MRPKTLRFLFAFFGMRIFAWFIGLAKAAFIAAAFYDFVFLRDTDAGWGCVFLALALSFLFD